MAHPARIKIHKDMFRGLTAAEIEAIMKLLSEESRDLASAETVNRVMLADIESQLRTVRQYIQRNKENAIAIKEALIVILEEYRHLIKRLSDANKKVSDLEISERRLDHEKTQIAARIAAVSVAINNGNDAYSRASPLVVGHFRNRPTTPTK